jgi:hypothetical protein
MRPTTVSEKRDTQRRPSRGYLQVSHCVGFFSEFIGELLTSVPATSCSTRRLKIVDFPL